MRQHLPISGVAANWWPDRAVTGLGLVDTGSFLHYLADYRPQAGGVTLICAGATPAYSPDGIAEG